MVANELALPMQLPEHVQVTGLLPFLLPLCDGVQIVEAQTKSDGDDQKRCSLNSANRSISAHRDPETLKLFCFTGYSPHHTLNISLFRSALKHYWPKEPNQYAKASVFIIS